MSHELRTPLNAILGFAEIIAEQSLGPNAGEQYRVYAQDIRDSGGHLLSLINDLLDVAKIESGRMELDRQNLDARYVIEAAIRFMALKAEARKQTIVLAADAGAVPFADERAFKQIVLNLLSNAVKFAPENGRIVIKVTALTNGGACLTVEDDGPGIAPEKISQLFKPFSQADNRYDRNAGGTGLGLSLVFGLTALHGGRVWVENRAPGGLAAHVEFPPARARFRAA